MSKKLSLKTEQLRVLSSSDLDAVAGGIRLPKLPGAIVKAIPEWLRKLSSALKPTDSAVHHPAANPTKTALTTTR